MVVPLAAAGIALPAVKTLTDCADYSKTFEPFLPQLYALPSQICSSLGDFESLKHIYASTNPAISGLAFCAVAFPVFFLAAEFNKNYSQVDRFWSLLPTFFNIHYALWARVHGLPTQRVDNVLAFSVVWSARLTFNYWRRGGYQRGSEDYRWELIKKHIGSFAFLVLNIVFISSVQLVLLWSVTLPTYILLLTSTIKPEVDSTDVTLSRLLMALVVFEYFADQQQWNYHEAKKQYQKTAKVPQGWTRAQMDRGFNTSGLWRFSRHPNFAAEQSIWILLYQWSCIQSNTLWNWSCVGAIGYVSVFLGSTPLTEWISAGKYPEYQLYKERVGRFLPSILGGGWNEQEAEQLGPKYAAQSKKQPKNA